MVGDINLGGENDGDAVINIPKEFLITDAEYAIESKQKNMWRCYFSSTKQRSEYFFKKEQFYVQPMRMST